MSSKRTPSAGRAISPQETAPLTAVQVAAFHSRVLDHYDERGREMPWRETEDPYEILVSEVMLQQTQVPRVLPAYERFLAEFPTPDALAAAPKEAVLRSWQGLGYNRRAIRLKQAAEAIVDCHEGNVPDDFDALLALPGVGPTTAAGVMAFAFGAAHPYIETNVRAALLHDFFAHDDDVPDKRLVPVFDQLIEGQDPRVWLYALMDYGSHLKRTVPNPSRRSRHYARQSKFEGSRRQKRSRLLRAVMERPASTDELAASLGMEYSVAEEILTELAEEGFLSREGELYAVAE